MLKRNSKGERVYTKKELELRKLAKEDRERWRKHELPPEPKKI